MKYKKISGVSLAVILCVVFLLWMISMYFATISTACSIRDGACIGMERAYDGIYNSTNQAMKQKVDNNESGNFLYNLYLQLRINPLITTAISSGRPLGLIEPDAESLEFQYAAAVCDRGGNILGRRSNCIYFQYYGEDGSKPGFAVVPLDELLTYPENAAVMDEIMRNNDWKLYVELCFTGTMDGNYMTVQKIEGLYDDSENAANSQRWHALFTDYANVPEDSQTVTLKTEYHNLRFIYNHKTDGGSYGNSFEYKNLSEIIDKIIDYNIVNDKYIVFNSPELNRSIDVKYSQLFDPRTGEYDLYLVTVMSVKPLRAAMHSLTAIYIITGCLAVFLSLILWLLLMKKLIRPVKRLTEAASKGKGPMISGIKYHELIQLNDAIDSSRLRLQEAESEIVRMKKAVKYAEQSEANRRLMTSNIAHELKTPLAVIHSYAEGLQEHIADNKRDQYLNVILSETERMDGMVLEMLDLSRMESGRVKLFREEFSLTELALSIFNRLESAYLAKELTVEVDAKEKFPVYADRSRIEQVIINFATNAIRHTPHGGKIKVLIYQLSGITKLYIENEGEHIQADALDKIWESFYRTDKARGKGSGGTGLGLAIAHSIIELHGGICSVNNTVSGVVFGFEL